MSDKMFKDCRITLTERSRNRMKLTIKLGAEEAEGFRNFMSVTRPEEVSEEEYLRSLFFHGIERLKEQLEAVAREKMGIMASELDEVGPSEEVDLDEDVDKL